eukprot:TRINITY_DN15170_c0_g1_i1.p1 TRINITY_DN15170_c0_g1~~TRINITY_DN15170_c0_g1_i1.p1  ORF type:complete len:264 (+),score=71.02 TRINITY_DN15170_c0_g1_i1:73-864(+)
MALAHELNPADNSGPLSDQSRGLSFGELIRDYEPLPDTKWRFGKPNYERVNKAYFEKRTMKHAEGSLEAVVQKLVKNWEVESHHIADVHQWQTMDITKFKAALNGGCPANAQLMADIGPYNMLLGETMDYSAKANTFESSNKIFSNTFPEGFAFEVLEVYSGPPVVNFKWRHFGRACGSFLHKDGKTYKGNGEWLDLVGLCVAKVNAELKIESLDIYYNPDDMIKPLITTHADKTALPVGEDEADGQTQAKMCTGDGGKCSVM